MATPTAPRHCGYCGQIASKLCGKCNSIRYCQVDCQKKDWRIHKTLCGTQLDLASRPSPPHRRGILLPVNSTKPVLVWIETDAEDEEEGERREEVQDQETSNCLGLPQKEAGAAESVGTATDDEAVPVSAAGANFPEGGDEDAVSEHFVEWDHELEIPYCDDPTLPTATPIFDDLLMDDGMVQTKRLVLGKKNGGEHLAHGLHLALRADSYKFLPNKCLKTLTDEKLARTFKGSLVIYGLSKVANSGICVDIGIMDLGLAMRGLLDLAEAQDDPLGRAMSKMQVY